MKATATSLSASVLAEKSLFAVLADLFKARLTSLVLLTTFVGFYIGVAGQMDYRLMFNTMLATALLASGAAAHGAGASNPAMSTLVTLTSVAPRLIPPSDTRTG